jgi:hypothetical protein
MSNKKKQHFIPKFYLKYFSVNSLNKSIGIFNLSSSKFIQAGDLRNQAYKDYFYGSDLKVEDAFSKIEGETALIIKSIIENDTIPKRMSDEHDTLLTFIMLFHARTVYALERINEFIDKVLKSVLSEDSRFTDGINTFNFHLKHGIHRVLKETALLIPLVYDLHFKIILNKTDVPFITSDHPVVLYNQFLEARKKYGSNTGFANKGLEVFVPLSPSHIVIFFDKDVYKIGSKNEQIIVLNSVSDVDNLNLLQCLNANENLYFDHQINESYIFHLLQRINRYKRTAKANVDKFLKLRNKDIQEKQMLLHSYNSDIICNLSLSFIHILRKAKKYELGDKVVHVRNEEICRLHQHFSELVEKGEYRISEFNKFLRDVQKNHDIF